MAELNEAESTKDAKKTKKEKKMEEKAAKKAAKKAKKNHEADKPDAENDDSDSVSSKIVMVLVTILIIAIWLGIFAVFVKADVGGFGSTVLAPALKDVPVLSKILPDSGTITASESTETAGYTNLDDAVSRIKELEKQLDDANSKNQADAQTINDLNAQIQDLSTYKEEQAAFEEEKEKYYEEVVFSDKAPDIKEYKKFYEQVDPANAEILYKQVCEQLEQDDEIKDYAQTYSKMKPKEAAAIFDSKFVAASNEIVLVTTPEPTSITDSYSLLKALYKRPDFDPSKVCIRVISNRAASKEDGSIVFNKINSVVMQFLNGSLEYLGYVPSDAMVEKAVRQQKILSIYDPTSKAARSFEEIAKRLLDNESAALDEKRTISHVFSNFFNRKQ